VTDNELRLEFLELKDINNADQVREYIRFNECHLDDGQALEVMTRMGMMIEPPTTAERSESYSKSAQSEPSPQYEERQSSSHSRCKYRHAQIVASLLARMGSTLESNPQARLVTKMERFSRTWLALWTCEEAECQALRRLVEQVLSNPRPE